MKNGSKSRGNKWHSQENSYFVVGVYIIEDTDVLKFRELEKNAGGGGMCQYSIFLALSLHPDPQAFA